MNTVAVPRIIGEYINVYKPKADYYHGPSTDTLIDGKLYAEWLPNDHSIIRGKDGLWHIIGETGPVTGVLHEGEYHCFHVRTSGQSLEKALEEQTWVEEPKSLCPNDRPDEGNRFYAPCVIEKGDLYYMMYGPQDIRYAISPNLYDWTPRGTLFVTRDFEGDPMIIKIGGQYYMYMLHHPAGLSCRTSPDLMKWSEPVIVYEHSSRQVNCESPFMVCKDDLFYLFWCQWDWDNSHGPFDHRTRVFCSDDPLDFAPSKQIAMLNAHAPEVVQDQDGKWFISSAEWPSRGISLARLEWI